MRSATDLIIGVGLLVWRQNDVLMGLRRDVPPVWSFPGGRLESHESIESCARRELMEEAGPMAIGDVQLFVVANIKGSSAESHTATSGMFAEHRTGEPLVCGPDKFLEWRWVSPLSIPSNLFAPTQVLLEQWAQRRSRALRSRTSVLFLET